MRRRAPRDDSGAVGVSRLMSVALTEEAVVARRKTVTRRLGWRFAKAGDRITLCRKVMGRKPDEPLVRLAEVEIVSVRREPLFAMRDEDIPREAVPLRDAFGHPRFDEWYDDTGLPTATAWVSWFAWAMDCLPDTDVTRIEWRYLDPA